MPGIDEPLEATINMMRNDNDSQAEGEIEPTGRTGGTGAPSMPSLMCFKSNVKFANLACHSRLNGVIVELSKKLRIKQENTIMEEEEPEGNEISYHEGSVYNSEINLTNPHVECQTDSLEETRSSHAEMDHNFVQEITEELQLNENAIKDTWKLSKSLFCAKRFELRPWS
uniref:Uncharacterized protein n=1 Tax=Glossina morsitans morsitans TaxID=37546 RepID=A0A1B0FRA2_GLOMM